MPRCLPPKSGDIFDGEEGEEDSGSAFFGAVSPTRPLLFRRACTLGLLFRRASTLEFGQGVV